jgi:hypothetical protein
LSSQPGSTVVPLPNLFVIAAANEAVFPARFEQLCGRVAPDHAGTLRGFCERVLGQARVSINMTTGRLTFFLADGRHLNPYELAKKLAPEQTEEKLRALQGEEWYEKRVTFDRWFERGEELRYGALNIGGAGLEYYGRFCVVFDRLLSEASWQTAYLPGNSLMLYVTGTAGSHSVDDDAVRRDAASPGQRHQLAAIKHADHVAGTAEKDWPAMVCSKDVFVEAVFLGAATPSGVEEIRIAQERSRRFAELLAATFSGTLEKGEMEEARAWPGALAALDAAGLLDRVREV